MARIASDRPPASVEHTIRRALRRAEDGRVLAPDEAEALMRVRGDDLERLLRAARATRDANPRHGGVVSFSKKVFIPLTRLCRDRCGYCTFATTPEHVQPFLTPDEV